MIYIFLTLINVGLVVLNLWIATDLVNYLVACFCAASAGFCAALGFASRI